VRQTYKSQDITTKIETGGEITINLVLTIKLDGSNLSISTGNLEHQENIRSNDKVNLMIPDIESFGIVEFGDKVL